MGAFAAAIAVFLGLLSLFCFLGSPDNVFLLRLPNFRFLIPLGHYISKRSTSYGPLEFDCTVSSFFFFNFFRLSLSVFSSVEDSPVDLTRIPLRKECRLTSCIKKLENLPMGLGEAPPMSWVGLVLAETSQLDLHGC